MKDNNKIKSQKINHKEEKYKMNEFDYYYEGDADKQPVSEFNFDDDWNSDETNHDQFDKYDKYENEFCLDNADFTSKDVKKNIFNEKIMQIKI